MNDAVITDDERAASCDLVLLVAHGQEARPLIKQFGLTPLGEKPFRIYTDSSGLRLIVSGMGKVLAAAATGYIAAEADGAAYLNIGIAGHGAARVGQGFLINKLLDVATGRVQFPTPLGLKLPGCELHTVDRPQLEYPSAVAYDMEASGFFSAASRVGTLDLVHCYKLISDTPEQDVSHIGKEMLDGLFADRAAEIESLVCQLRAQARARRKLHSLPSSYYTMKQRLRLSVTQSHQLSKLSRRCMALGLQGELQRIAEEATPDSGEVLRQLSAVIAARA